MSATGRFAGQVAFITGAARGQGRSHAVALAEEGADVIAVDIAAQIDTVPYPMASEADLAETAELVEKAGGRCVAVKADVRDIHALDAALRSGVSALGRLDMVIANAGILNFGALEESLDESAQRWSDAIGVMLTGVFNTIRVCHPVLVEQGTGGSITVTSSTAGLRGMLDGTGGIGGYNAAKHGVVGLVRGYAKLLGKHQIRVNAIHPAGVSSPMIVNDVFPTFHASRRDAMEPSQRLLPVPLLEERDITAALLWLVSEDARYVTGISLPVDAGVSCP
jgi:SDR family mycofactocin-dependent oxidoreductase